MRYIVDSNNYVTAVSFGTSMEYNDCQCIEYTGMVPSRWNSLEAWYLDEGDKLWRWRIINGELVMDESAVAPEEEDWLGVAVHEATYATNPGFDTTSLTFDLPDGTKKLAGFIILPDIDWATKDPLDRVIYCLSLHSSIEDNITNIVCVGLSVGAQRYYIERKNIENAFELGENYVKVTISSPDEYYRPYFCADVEYTLYPFYRRGVSVSGGGGDADRYIEVSYTQATGDLEITDPTGDVVGYSSETGNLSVSRYVSYNSETKNLSIGG